MPTAVIPAVTSDIASTQNIPDRMIDAVQLADILGVSMSTIRRWYSSGVIPGPIMLRRKRLWHPGTVAKIVSISTDFQNRRVSASA